MMMMTVLSVRESRLICQGESIPIARRARGIGRWMSEPGALLSGRVVRF